MHEREQGDDLRALQQGVEKRLGLCLLRLQHYERLLTEFLARQQLSASVDTIENAKAERIAIFERQTLGALMNQLLGSYFTVDPNSPWPDDDPEPDGVCTFSFRSTTVMLDDDYKQLSFNFKELVTLRNTLVHHFIDDMICEPWRVANRRHSTLIWRGSSCTMQTCARLGRGYDGDQGADAVAMYLRERTDAQVSGPRPLFLGPSLDTRGRQARLAA
jgi:hypothetical protein